MATIVVSIAPLKCADERRNVLMHAFCVVTGGNRARDRRGRFFVFKKRFFTYNPSYVCVVEKSIPAYCTYVCVMRARVRVFVFFGSQQYPCHQPIECYVFCVFQCFLHQAAGPAGWLAAVRHVA